VAMLADAAATYATATGTGLDLGAALGNMRLSGFPLLAEDGVISQFNEADNTGLNCSLATFSFGACTYGRGGSTGLPLGRAQLKCKITFWQFLKKKSCFFFGGLGIFWPVRMA
jgi:hypothetical protein